MKSSTLFKLVGTGLLCGLLGACDDDKTENYYFYGDQADASSTYVSQSLTGTWSGTSATGQVPSTLILTESAAHISGVLKWPGGDTRNVAGTRSGNVVGLNVEGGDIWRLTYSNGNALQGSGTKPNGKSYAVNFSRQ